MGLFLFDCEKKNGMKRSERELYDSPRHSILAKDDKQDSGRRIAREMEAKVRGWRGCKNKTKHGRKCCWTVGDTKKKKETKNCLHDVEQTRRSAELL